MGPKGPRLQEGWGRHWGTRQLGETRRDHPKEGVRPIGQAREADVLTSLVGRGRPGHEVASGMEGSASQESDLESVDLSQH